MRTRYLQSSVEHDLEQKMVFLAGPRQVGKTTLAKMIAQRYSKPVYLNWDNPRHRKDILRLRWSPDSDILILDEVHKNPEWKNLVKGIWDTRPQNMHILVTGSSRLNIYRRGGDSLMGRYLLYRLHPFSLRELSCIDPETCHTFVERPPVLSFDTDAADLNPLFEFGGFPEPALSCNSRVWRRWKQHRFETVIREDIRDTTRVQLMVKLEMMGHMLQERSCSPLSMNSIAGDLEVSPKTVKNWIEVFCRNYYTFRVPPYHRSLHRALRKEAKYYLWDWSVHKDDGKLFENLIASHLLKFCHFVSDISGISVKLYYLRDTDKREVDFLVVWEDKPWLIAECKLKPGGGLTPLRYFSDRLNIKERYLIVMENGIDHLEHKSGIRIISANNFLMSLI